MTKSTGSAPELAGQPAPAPEQKPSEPATAFQVLAAEFEQIEARDNLGVMPISERTGSILSGAALLTAILGFVAFVWYTAGILR